MSPGARGDFLADRPAPGRRDVAPPKPQHGYPPPYYSGMPTAQANTWLGAPLISMANHRRGCKPFFHEEAKRREDFYAGHQTQLFKMAMHAQGAPLIIQGRYANQRRYAPPSELKGFRRPDGRQFIAYDRCDKPENNLIRNAGVSHVGRSSNMDAVSVASDESSGSTNSEAALPRIIKPRKRRKKDRKPTNVNVTHEIINRKHEASDDSVEPQSPGVGVAYKMSFFEDSPSSVANYRSDASTPFGSDTKHYANGLEKNYAFSGLAITDDVNKFMRACEAESAASVCQCRYCDPSGQIWDIDSFNFSELFDESSTVDFAPTKLEDSMKVVGSNSKKTTQVKERDTTLRRSWSDPSSSHSIANRKIENEMSASLQDSVSSSPDLLYSLFSSTPLNSRATDLFGITPRLSSESEAATYRLVPDLKLDMRSDCPSVNLEVSSEIVTSLNGHRDLEIKFFSTTPPATAAKTNSFFNENSVHTYIKTECQSEVTNESSELTSKCFESLPKVACKLTCENLSDVT